MKRYSSEELMELAAEYALGAVSADEQAAMEEGIASSPALAEEVASYREVALRLAQQRAVAPPADVRDRLLARVRVTPQAAAPDGSGSPPAPAETPIVPITAARSVVRRPMWMTALLAASVIVATALALQNGRLRRSLDAQQAQFAAQSAAQATQLAAARAAADTRTRQLDRILEAEADLYVAQMRGADSTAGPGIQFFWNDRRNVAMLHAFRLKPAPPGRVYQLWLIRDGKPVSASVFNSDPDGHALVENIEIPGSAAGVTQVLLTEEPAGGSPGPTTQPFLGGRLGKT